jgi:hypothetical protein
MLKLVVPENAIIQTSGIWHVVWKKQHFIPGFLLISH